MSLYVYHAFPQQLAMYDGAKETVSDNELRILTWNIQMRPRFIPTLGRGGEIRSRIIPQKLIDDKIDIIVFQEAFDKQARKILTKRLKDTYPYIIGPANRKGFHIKTNSGVMIFSKIPLEHLEEIQYNDCSGADCLGRKGALLVQGKWRGVSFQVLGTHLQSGGDDEIRKSQYRQIRALIDRHKKQGVPQFLCGDFNTQKAGNPALYTDMLSTLDAEDGALSSKLVYTEDPVMNDMRGCSDGDYKCDVIDYILYRKNGFTPKSMARLVRQYKHRWCKQYKDLSDHNAVLMKVRFK